MTRLERLLPVLAALSGTTLRLLRGKSRPEAADGPAVFQPIPTTPDTWLEVKGGGERAAAELADVIGDRKSVV